MLSLVLLVSVFKISVAICFWPIAVSPFFDWQDILPILERRMEGKPEPQMVCQAIHSRCTVIAAGWRIILGLFTPLALIYFAALSVFSTVPISPSIQIVRASIPFGQIASP